MAYEWKDWANSFNSYKGLLYSEHYRAIDEWRLGEKKAPPPPIEVSLDPIHNCQLHCSHCNFSKYLKSNKEARRMPDNHIMSLVRFLASWGVKGICYGGGGEPTLHTKLADVLLLSKSLGLGSSIATNGINFDDRLIKVAVNTCRWVGVSVDAATEKTYVVGRRGNYFNTVIENIKKLVQEVDRTKNNCDIAYKLLIMDYNQGEIYDACKLAKSLGVKDFHARPADLRHQGMGRWKKRSNKYNIPLIQEQFEKCHELEDDKFRVFTVTHKYKEEDFTPKRRFSQCCASSICIQLCAEGGVYLCPDTRLSDYYKLGMHYPNPEEILKIWGSKKHYDLVFKNGAKKCTSRCTFGVYNEQCERLFINKDDPMCKNFV